MTTASVIALDSLPADLRLSIEAGHTSKQLCPRCDGGSTRERSLYIRYSDDGVVRLHCYRASCGWWAVMLNDPDAEVTRKKIKRGSVYREPTVPVDEDTADMLSLEYGLDWEWYERRWRLADDGRLSTLVMTVRDPYGLERGHQTRTLGEGPKRCFTFRATAQPFLDWWIEKFNMSPVVVVEDALSACRLSQIGYNSVALLGTGISREAAKEIFTTAAGREIILALDRDAFSKAIKLADRHRPLWGSVRVLCLTQDIKNMAYDYDITELIESGRARTDRSLPEKQESI